MPGKKSICSLLLIGVFAAVSSQPASASDGAPFALFATALESRFNLDSSQRVRLTTRADSGAESVRVVEMALKQIRGRLHALAEIVEPSHLRGTRVLSIEADDRNDDQFIFMPSHDRVRRISGAQRADLFFGTDVTLEDFERHHPDDFKLVDEGGSDVRGETVQLVAAYPKFESDYVVALYMIAADGMTLEIRYFGERSAAPRRIVRAYRSEGSSELVRLIPARLEIENYRRGTVTTVDFEAVVDRAAPDGLFTTDSLKTSKKIPYLDEPKR